MIKLKFAVTEQLLFRATRDIYKTARISLFLNVLLVVLPLLLFAVMAYQERSLGVTLWLIPLWVLPLLGLVFVTLLFPSLQYLAAVLHIRMTPLARQKQHYEFDAQGIRNYGQGMEIKLDWDRFVRVAVSKRYLLLFVSRGVAYFLPLKFLADREVEQIINWYQSTKLETKS